MTEQTKTLYECVEDAYNALKIAWDHFDKDKDYWGGNHHFEWVSSVGMTGIISFNKQFTKYGTYTPLTVPKHEPKQIPSPQSQTPSGQSNQCTEKQAKAVFVITHDKVGSSWERNKKFSELETYGITNKNDIKNMSYKDASAFIEKFGGN